MIGMAGTSPAMTREGLVFLPSPKLRMQMSDFNKKAALHFVSAAFIRADRY
jgi:hypothetical protein